MLEEISFPSALKHKTDGAIGYHGGCDISTKSFTLTATLTSIDFVPLLLGIAGNPERGTNDSLLRDCGNAGSCCPDPIFHFVRQPPDRAAHFMKG
jgi:hypothetical protein